MSFLSRPALSMTGSAVKTAHLCGIRVPIRSFLNQTSNCKSQMKSLLSAKSLQGTSCLVRSPAVKATLQTDIHGFSSCLYLKHDFSMFSKCSLLGMSNNCENKALGRKSESIVLNNSLLARHLNTTQCTQVQKMFDRNGEKLPRRRSVRGSRERSAHSSDKSTNKEAEVSDVPAAEGLTQPEQATETLVQRFKRTYKEHGKILVAVHVATSIVWFGSFYTIARLGFDIVPLLESWNFSEKVINPFKSGGLGDIAVAYLMYKLATPARYTVTLGGTNLAIRYLRKGGRMKVVPKEDSLRSLYKEGAADIKARSRTQIQGLRQKHRARRARRKNKSKQ